MNFYHLTKKYFPSASVTVEDRTYDGLIWHGPGEKPLIAIFEAFQKEEDRLVRASGKVVADIDNLMHEKQRQARAQAKHDIIPVQQKLGTYFEEERLKAVKLAEQALEIKGLLTLKEQALDCWREITSAQEAINAQAQAYLEETKQYLAWDQDKVPAEVQRKRIEAHKLLSEGVLVYANWKQLREAELPSREELRQSLLKGGEELARMKKTCEEIKLKYPKPRKQHY